MDELSDTSLLLPASRTHLAAALLRRRLCRRLGPPLSHVLLHLGFRSPEKRHQQFPKNYHPISCGSDAAHRGGDARPEGIFQARW